MLDICALEEPITNLHVEDAGDPDSAADPLQTQRRHFLIITVLKSDAERRQQRSPGQLLYKNKYTHGGTTQTT